MTFFGHSYGDGWTLDAWVNQYKEQVDGVTHQIVSEYTYTLPSGIVAHRMNMRSGTGGYPVLLTVIDGYGITVEGVMADTSWFTRVTSSLRTTR